MNEISRLLHKADRSLNAAGELLKHGDVDFAASRAYYGYFYIAETLLYSLGLSYSKHSQVISQYGARFAKTNILDPRFHRLMMRAFDLRQKGDYEAEAAIDEGEVQELIQEGRAFLEAARAYLERVA